MLTAFDLFKLLGAVTGAIVGFVQGHEQLGWIGAVGGVALGFIMGAFIGNLPWLACWTWFRIRLKRCSIPQLKERLQREYFVSHLLIAELVARGEPLEQFREHVAGLLHSHNSAERSFGEGTARIWFPDLLGNASPASSKAIPPVENQ